jgi:hypothetical protein
MLRELLALNFSVIYVNNVFRFCSISIMVAAVSNDRNEFRLFSKLMCEQSISNEYVMPLLE